MRTVLLSLLALAGCSGSPSATGDLGDDTALAGSGWLVLDIDAGSVTPVAGTVDPADPAWGGRRILFRALAPATATIGRAVADVIAEDDEHPLRSQAQDRLWIAACELTQAQWFALAGTRPWQAVLPVADTSTFIGDNRPAFGISARMAEQALSRPLADGWLLDLPEADEWEYACLAGAGKFAWGDAIDGGAGMAVLDAEHPEPIASRQPNAWGLHDMHGNVWELVRHGVSWQVRGGGWDQAVITARASNQVAVDADTIGWNVGLRPVLRR